MAPPADCAPCLVAGDIQAAVVVNYCIHMDFLMDELPGLLRAPSLLLVVDKNVGLVGEHGAIAGVPAGGGLLGLLRLGSGRRAQRLSRCNQVKSCTAAAGPGSRSQA